MENQLIQELIFQGATILISLVATVVGFYLRQYLKTSKVAIKYGLDNEVTERLMNNAIMYAEATANTYASKGIRKRELANSYLNKISPETVAKYGEELEMMLDRKVEQLLSKSKNK